MKENPAEELTDFELSESVSDPEPREGSEEHLESEAAVDRLESLAREREEFHDRWLRNEAEIQNLRKRFAREKAELAESERVRVLKEILPVIDSCERGLESLDEEASSDEVKVYHEGLELLLKGLKAVLSRFEVVEVSGVGERFDPMVHEALLVEDREDRADGEVLELFRKGYSMKSRLLRPAQVKVASVPSEVPVKHD